MSRYQARGVADGLFYNHDRGDPVIDAGDAERVIDEYDLSEEELTDAALELLVGGGHLQALLDELRPRIVARALAKRRERA